MRMNPRLLAAICAVMGALQAWDSGVLGAPMWIQALVAVAIALPVVALVAEWTYGRQAATVAAAFALLTIARVASPTPLPTLHLIAFIPAIVIFFLNIIAAGPAATRR